MSIFRTVLNFFIELTLPEKADLKKILLLDQSTLKRILPKAERPTDRYTFALFDYRNKYVRTIVWAIKYKNHPELLKFASKFLYEEIVELSQDKMTFENKNKIALIPIPMDKISERKRGWNQSLELCNAITTVDKKFGNSEMFVADILLKVKHTKHQRKLSRNERLENIQNSLQLKPDTSKNYDREKLMYGALPIIIDDVTTTGATLEEARRALSELGFKNVLAVTIAH